MRFLLLLLFAGIAATLPARAQKEGGEEILTRAFPAGLGMFKQVVNGALVKPDDDTVRPLPSAADGEPRSDVRGWYISRGVEPEGLAMVLLERSGLLVVRGPKKSVELVEGIMAMCGGCPMHQLDLTVRLWTFESEPQAAPLAQPRTIEELRAQGGKTLRLLDANTVLTISGGRAYSECRAATAFAAPPKPTPPKPPPPPEPAAKPEPAKPPAEEALISAEEAHQRFGEGVRGSLVHVEMNIGPDGESITIMLAYHARIASGDGGDDIVVDAHATNEVGDGRELAIFNTVLPAAAPGGKLRHRVVTVAPRILDAWGRTREQREKAEEARRLVQDPETVALVRKALDGLPASPKGAK